MSYTILKTDGTILLTLGVGKIDQITTSLTLIGKNVEPYGEFYNNSLVNLLENFASNYQPRNPMVGQLWFNTDPAYNKLFVYNIYNEFVPIGGGSVVAATPTALPTRTGTVYGYTSTATNGSTLLGYCVGNVTMTGLNNIAIGQLALSFNTYGNDNNAQGYGALTNNTSGNNNIAFGNASAFCNSSGADNFAAGNSAFKCNTIGSNNIAIGHGALYGYVVPGGCSSSSGGSIVSGNNNVAFGCSALYSNSCGMSNFAAGNSAMLCNSSGCNNIAIGEFALYGYGGGNNCDVWGHNNIAMGANTLYNNTYGCNNTAMGKNALYCNKYGTDNIAIGECALYQSQYGCDNIAMGYHAGMCNQYGYGNIYIGALSGVCANSFDRNSVIIGCSASMQGGNDNVAIGSAAGGYGGMNQSVAVGSCALYHTSAGCNSALGLRAGAPNTYGSNNTFIGFNSCGASPSSSNAITLGNNSISSIRANVTTITSLSDCRDKTNISGIPVGLDFIKEVRPVKFTWADRNGGKTGIDELGFLAQDLDALQKKYNVKDSLKLVLEDNPDKLEATPGNLLPVLVKAVQDLAIENDILSARLDEMQLQLNTLLSK